MAPLFYTLVSGKFGPLSKEQQLAETHNLHIGNHKSLLKRPPTCGCRLWPLLVKLVLLLLALLMLFCMPNHQSNTRYTIDVHRHIVHGKAPELHGFVNTPDQYHQAATTVTVSVCSSLAHNPHIIDTGVRYNWTFTHVHTDLMGPSNQTEYHVTNDLCSITWKAPSQGKYHVQVQAWHPNAPSTSLGHGESVVTIADLWLAVVGDSFAAGQGNPDTINRMYDLVQPNWIDSTCCRSSRSYAFKLYERLARDYPEHNILFTYLPCSGSSLREGLLGPGSDGVSQLERLLDIRGVASQAPDLLLLSIGGNDIGYSDVLMAMIWNEMQHLIRVMPRRLQSLRKQLHRLSSQIDQLTLKSHNRVLVTEYYDFSKNQNGIVDANCEDLSLISQENLEQADESVTRALNKALRTFSEQHKWTFTNGIYSAFSHHGICCTDNQSFVLSPASSQQTQGNSFGAFHPNERGHEVVAKIVYQHAKRVLKGR